MSHSATDFILNFDQSAYHIALLPEDICPFIFTVGDPTRVELFKPFFEKGYKEVQKREFRSLVGKINNQRVLVISTGIGPDNIDIVMNEIRGMHLKALELGLIQTKELNIIRLGTSGAIQPEIQLDDIIYAESAIGLDNLPYFYKTVPHIIKLPNLFNLSPYLVDGHVELSNQLKELFKRGITLTSPGFYGPQFRSVFLSSRFSIQEITAHFSKSQFAISNIEMETAAIYFFAKQFNYRAISISAILAHRLNHQFSINAETTIQNMIEKSLQIFLNEKNIQH